MNSRAMFFKKFASSTGYDADAQAFINAVGTLTTAQQAAINNLVIGLKANGTWSKYYAIYPFVGGTASSHKWNLKDPRDLDAAYRLTQYGTITHNNNGIAGDGSTGYYIGHLIAGNVLTNYNTGFSIYSRTSGVSTPNGSAREISLGGYIMETCGGNNRNYVDTYDTVGRIRTDGYNGLGYYTHSCRSNTLQELYINGVLVKTGSIISGALTTTIPLTLFCSMTSPTNYITWSMSTRNLAFASVNAGLTATEILNDYNVIQSYQTALGRQV